MNNIHELIIIGGGPAGLSAALYAARADLKPLVFAGSPPGGQLMLTTEVENFPGVRSLHGPQLVQTMRQQAQSFGASIKDENITAFTYDQANKIGSVTTSQGEYKSRAVIISTGAKALWLNLESEQRLRGRGVSACATCDGFFFKNKIVAVVGGGDTAMEEASFLTKFATKVYIFHRRDKFRASQAMQKKVFENSKIEVVYNSEIKEVLGQEKVEGVKVSVNGEEKEFAIDGFFLAIGHKPDTELFSHELLLDEKGYIINTLMLGLLEKSGNIAKLNLNKFSRDSYQYPTATSKLGVFAAGDCVDYIYRQAGVAAGMGIMAALDAQKWLENLS